MHSTRQIYTFVIGMTVIVALILAGLSTVLKPIHLTNEAVFNKKAILSAVLPGAKDLTDEQVEEQFKTVEQMVLDYKGAIKTKDEVKKLRNFKDKEGKAEDLDLSKEKKRNEKDRLYPLYKFVTDKNETLFITAVRGSGLWDEIWGYIAIKDDFNTIYGTSFDHKAETPGLGAEIKDNPTFPNSFKGKQLYNKDGEFVSVLVKKGGADKTDKNAVDGISGATVTCDGVTDMLKKGLQYYMPYFDTLKK